MAKIPLFSHVQIVEAVIGFLRDPHPRVRYAACNAIGQMATDFAPVFQKKFHESVVPGLLLVMDDGVNPRVQVCMLLNRLSSEFKVWKTKRRHGNYFIF